MKKIILLSAAAFSLVCNDSFAQDRHFFENPEKIERENFNLEFSKVVSKEEYIKFAMELENSTNDYILFNNAEGTIVANDESLKSDNEKTIVYEPNESEKKTFDVKGSNLLVEDFKFTIDNFYLIPANGNVIEMPEFKLPAEKNSFTVGNFKVELIRLRKKTDLTTAKFKCTYLGDDYAIVRPNNASVRVKEDKIFANETRTKGSYLLKKGDEIAFTLSFKIEARVVDMQFADMFILWNDMFQESKKKPLKGETVEFKLDKALTEEKAK